MHSLIYQKFRHLKILNKIKYLHPRTIKSFSNSFILNYLISGSEIITFSLPPYNSSLL